METKEKILRAALSLFNEKGTPVVTTRHIAAHISISQGNLHYHYPNKDVLINVLFENFLDGITSSQRYSNQSMSIEDVLGSMKDNFTLMYKYRFLFIDRDYIWKRQPEIEKTFKSLISRKKTEIRTLLSYYMEDGTVRPDLTPVQIEALLEQFEFIMTCWVHMIPFQSELLQHEIPEYFARFCFRMWFPYLTPEVYSQWENALNIA